MESSRPVNSSFKLAADRVAVPIHLDEAPLKLCVVLSKRANEWEPILIKHHAEFVVLLGCVVDAAATVHDWTEIWVQRVLEFEGGLASLRTGIDNHAIDRRWARTVQAWQQNLPKQVIAFSQPSRPLWIDTKTLTCWHPVDPESGAYRRCDDEAALQLAGLPSYATSLYRYLYSPSTGKTKFLRLGPPASAEDTSPAVNDFLPNDSALPINPEAAPLLVRRFHPFSLEALSGFIGGMPIEESIGPENDRINGVLPGSGETIGSYWLFASQSGPASRIIETLYLKLSLITQAIHCVRNHTKTTQSPLLGLTASSFRVELESSPAIAPFLWTSRVMLADPGDAAEVKVPGVDTRYFLPLKPEASPYRAFGSARQVEGRCTFRIREVLADAGGEAVIVGTLSSQDRMRVDRDDLIHLSVAIGRIRCQLWSMLEEGASLVAGEWRVRSLPQELPANVVDRLQEFQGSAVYDVPFELLQSMSTPCDVYSLAILALRVLLVNSRRKLPSVVDDFAAMVSELRTRSESGKPLVDCIEALFQEDPRWAEQLGPANLLYEPNANSAAAIPISFWREVLACIVRMIPGQLKESHLEDYGDAPEGAVHRVFEAPLHEWQTLTTQARSLLTLDWRANREIDAILRAEQGLPVGQSSAFAGGAPKPAPAAPAPSTPFANPPVTNPASRSPNIRPRDAVVIQRNANQENSKNS